MEDGRAADSRAPSDRLGSTSARLEDIYDRYDTKKSKSIVLAAEGVDRSHV